MRNPMSSINPLEWTSSSGLDCKTVLSFANADNGQYSNERSAQTYFQLSLEAVRLAHFTHEDHTKQRFASSENVRKQLFFSLQVGVQFNISTLSTPALLGNTWSWVFNADVFILEVGYLDINYHPGVGNLPTSGTTLEHFTALWICDLAPFATLLI